jgi:CBS domain-containing protein
MIIRSILKSKGSSVEIVGPETNIQEVSRILRQKKIGAVIVMQGSDIKGVLSERDIVRGLCEFGARVLEKAAGDLMTREVVTCSVNDSIIELMEVMTNNRIRHLPVVEKGKLEGVISIGDIVKHRIAETEMEAQALKEYIVSG